MAVVYWLFDETCSWPQTEGYVGVTRLFAERVRKHRRLRLHKGFDAQVLFEGAEEDCYRLEYELRPRAGIGWNLACGGPEGFKREISEETRLKLKRPKSEAHKLASGAGNRGKVRTDEMRLKLSEAHKGKVLAAEHRANIAASLHAMGFKPSPATRAARALLPPPTMLGRKHSPETKARMRAAALKRMAEGRGHTLTGPPKRSK